MINKTSLYGLQSQVIDFLRFPLIIGVVFIHNHAPTVTIPGMEFGAENFLPLHHYCSEFFSQVLARVAVPLFFFMSGFLFFLNVEKFNCQAYTDKLRSRAKTLLVPYLFWNLLAVAVFAILSATPLKSLINREITPSYLLQSLWAACKEGEEVAMYPIAYQFWFIRDLMVTALLTPVIYFICKTTKAFSVLLFGALWLFGFWLKLTGFSSTAVCFFTIGAVFGVWKINLLTVMGKIRWFSFTAYPVVAVADLLTESHYIHRAGILIGIVFWFNLAAILLKTGKVRTNSFLSAASFFIFAVHDPLLLTSLRKVTFMFFKPASDFAITGLYFLNVLIAVVAALVLYAVLQRIVPRFTGIITGGRTKNIAS